MFSLNSQALPNTGDDTPKQQNDISQYGFAYLPGR